MTFIRHRLSTPLALLKVSLGEPLKVWLSLCGPMLFFEMEAGPGLNPFAFLHTKYAKLAAAWLVYFCLVA